MDWLFVALDERCKLRSASGRMPQRCHRGGRDFGSPDSTSVKNCSSIALMLGELWGLVAQCLAQSLYFRCKLLVASGRMPQTCCATSVVAPAPTVSTPCSCVGKYHVEAKKASGHRSSPTPHALFTSTTCVAHNTLRTERAERADGLLLYTPVNCVSRKVE